MSHRPAVVLVQPRIAQNVGAIGRLCAAAGASLHIVRPIPFELSDRSLRRAGMDYLEFLEWHQHHDWAACEAALAGRQSWFLSTHAERSLYEAPFRAGDVLVFGSESSGLPEPLRERIAGEGLRIPMAEPRARSLNLAMSAAVALYELLRATGQCAPPAHPP